MSNLGNRQTMASNISHYLKLKGKERKEASKEMGFSYSTFNDWASGKVYPRIDKIEIMANYFGIQKMSHKRQTGTRQDIFIRENKKEGHLRPSNCISG